MDARLYQTPLALPPLPEGLGDLFELTNLPVSLSSDQVDVLACFEAATEALWEIREAVPGPHRLCSDPGFVYAARYGRAPQVTKIGLTRRHPQERLATLSGRTSAPGRLNLIFALQTPFAAVSEITLHKALGYRREKGEWFALDDEDLTRAMLALLAAHRESELDAHLWVSQQFRATCSRPARKELCEAGARKIKRSRAV